MWERAAGEFAFPLFVAQIALAVPSGLDSSSLPRTFYERDRFALAGLFFSLFFPMGCGRGRPCLRGVDLTFLLAGAGAHGISVGGVACRCRVPGRWFDASIWVGDWRRRDGLRTDVCCQFLDGDSAEQIQPAHLLD